MSESIIPEEIIKLRKTIHQNPDLSNHENKTANFIKEFILKFNPDETIENIGGAGIAFVFRGNSPGPEIMFRCELDALPISEINDFKYRSKSTNISHKCGHDGHMAIMTGLAHYLSTNKLLKGKVVLFFQPAEETGEGAERVIKDEKFQNIKPDYIFALHNLPGFPLHKIIVKNGIFASASKGLIIKLHGKTSHAAEPEKGLSPAIAAAKITQQLNALPGELNGLNEFALLTIIHVKVGERAFGTTPGEGEIFATLRAYQNDDMETLTNEAVRTVKKIADEENLQIEIGWTEEFPATINSQECVDLIIRSAEENNYEIEKVSNPFRWSEDFGHFTNNFNGAMFSLGSGVNHPDLHNPDYDFPDEIIETGVKMFSSILKIIDRNG